MAIAAQTTAPGKRVEESQGNFKDNLAHRRLKFEGLPEIAVAELPQVMSILRMKRQIQSKRMTQLIELLWGRSLAQHLLDGIAWHDMDHQKNERENEPEGWQRKEKSF